MNDVTIIIFGVTGDLTKRKIIPALYKLMKDKKLDKLCVVGASRGNGLGIKDILNNARGFIPTIDETVWNKLEQNSFFMPVEFSNLDDFKKLSNYVGELEQRQGMSGNRLVYMAIAPNFFMPVTQFIGEAGLLTRRDAHSTPWNRIAYEKPFGLDLDSAHQINGVIQQWFNEDQVYRIDHYLTKELVGNILMIRFANSMFEPLWNHKYIDHVQITLTESIGLEGRGIYYDNYGVLKDIVQNHMLQLLALVAMEAPSVLSSKEIRDKKSELLSKIRCTDGIVGQFDGYRSEEGVNPESTTPTFTLLRFEVDTPRWKGIPFYGKAGKRLDKKCTSIAIKFKDISCPLLEGNKCPSNYFIIEIAPDATFSLGLNVKTVGKFNELTHVTMDFCHSCVYGATTPEAYEVLLEQIIAGDQAISVRFDEIEHAWSVYERLEKAHMPLYEYQPGAKGPHEMDEFLKKYHVRWRV